MAQENKRPIHSRGTQTSSVEGSQSWHPSIERKFEDQTQTFEMSRASEGEAQRKG